MLGPYVAALRQRGFRHYYFFPQLNISPTLDMYW